MYQTGEWIIYGNSGVCRVESVGKPGFRGADPGQLYYVLKPLCQDGTIYAPVDSPKVFTRPVISAQEANRLIDRIPTIQAEMFHSRSVQELTGHYQKALQSHDCGDLIELVMSIYAKKQYVEQQRRKFWQVDEKFMRRAEEILSGEFSVALGIPREQVNDYIAGRVAQKK